MASERSGGDETADLVVVGAGIIGLACAWRAVEAGLETVVVDAGATERASEVAAGMIAPVGEAVWGEEARLSAAAASAELWPAFAADLEASSRCAVPYRRCGALHLGLDRDELAALRRLHGLHGELGLESSWLRASECRRLEPGLATNVSGGYAAPGEAEVDPRAVLVALRAALADAGTPIRENEVVEVLTEEGSTRGVRLAEGPPIMAPNVVLATGARLGDEATPAAAQVSVRPVAGEILRLRARGGEQPCERIVATERVYIVPRADGEVVIGATVVERGFDLRVRAGGVAELLREARRAVPDVDELDLVECSAGLRPATPDNAPVIGSTAIEGLLLAGGHYRNGILLAPITAAAIAAELTGAPSPPSVSALGPERFSSPRERVAG